MLLITCDHCKEEVVTSMYFDDTTIVKDVDPREYTTLYTASAYGRTICPHCGAEIVQHFYHTISKQDIVSLAVQGCLQ